VMTALPAMALMLEGGHGRQQGHLARDR
jgi:hypothetical protein